MKEADILSGLYLMSAAGKSFVVFISIYRWSSSLYLAYLTPLERDKAATASIIPLNTYW